MKVYTMNYKDPTNLMRGFFGRWFKPGTVNMAPKPGDVIVNTAKREDFAMGMMGTVIEEDKSANTPTYVMEWAEYPKKISSEFTCIQGGFITDDDKVQVIAEISMTQDHVLERIRNEYYNTNN